MGAHKCVSECENCRMTKPKHEDAKAHEEYHGGVTARRREGTTENAEGTEDDVNLATNEHKKHE